MRRLLLAPLAAILLLVTSGGTQAQMNNSAYNFEFEAIEGGKLPLSQWRNKVLLVVNVASFCGFTPQYEGLQKLWERYQSRGLVVMGVPANDFGAQEPKSEGEILEFCQGAFGVNFPMTTKQTVVGGQAHPFYLWARDTLGLTSTPRWNFHKYLVGRDGKLIAGFGSSVTPLSDTMINAVEKALGAP
jgi:glutathione peroxidase